MLTVAGVTHRYGQGPAVLHDVGFTYTRTGMLAVVGASGSGKSTLLAIIGGLIRPSDGGEVTFPGAAPDDATWVFQVPNVLGHRTAEANVAVGALASGGSWAAAVDAARGLLDDYGLAHVAIGKAGRLSGGEVQRVMLARAQAMRAPLLLADEPTGQLDHANTLMVAASLRRLADTGTTVVVATHDRSVSDLADATVELEDATATYVDRT
ncbi:MAG: ABC transporter ATP-binding protein [Acidimicrobiia bacterium]